MTEIVIRTAISSDIPEVVKLDHGCESSHVWQIEDMQGQDHIEVVLRKLRLPRALLLSYPRNPADLMENWTKHSLMLVAHSGDTLTGYLALEESRNMKTARIVDLVVAPASRRQGIGRGLLLAAQKWLKQRGFYSTILEFSTKNEIAYIFAENLNYHFCGYMDNYFNNGDFAFFFERSLK